MSEVLLRVKDLKIYYPVKVKSGFKTEKKFVKAVDGISFDVHKGETFGIVGESGCGKSTTGKAIVRLLTPTQGSIEYEGQDIFKHRNKQEALEFSKKIQIIFQDPYSSLDPRFPVGRCIGEPLIVHKTCQSAAERKERVLSLMKDVGLRPDHYTRVPHEFSGGQRQRIGVARALALNPSLIVCDEPVSALDVSIQAQILNLMQDLQKKYNLTYIFISHNLSVVKHICDRVAVMYLGHIVEVADKKNLFNHAKHPYTRALLDSIPDPNPDHPSMQEMLEGDVPSPMNPPSGCCFHTRCKHACEQCKQQAPVMQEIAPGHFCGLPFPYGRLTIVFLALGLVPCKNKQKEGVFMEIIRHPGSFFSRAVVHNGVIYFTGHVAKPGNVTMREQAVALTKRYDELLEQYGSDKNHILMFNAYFSDISEGKVFDEVMKEWLGDNMPAAVGVEAKLSGEGHLVELAVIAAVKEDSK